MLKSTTKKVLAFVVLSTILLSSFSVMAAPRWVFVGYDVSDNAIETSSFAKIYYEVDDKNIPTNLTKREGFASKIEWRHENYELAFPHKQYERLFLDGIATERVRYTGTVAPWEKKFVPYMWEITYPYNVWQELYSNIPGKGWTGTNYVEDSGDNANVIENFPVFGFDKYRFTADKKNVIDYSDVIDIAIPDRVIGLNNRSTVGFYNLDLASDLYNELIWGDPDSFLAGHSDINQAIDDLFSEIQRTDSLKLEGPAYNRDGAQSGKLVKDAVDEILFNHIPSQWIHPKDPIIMADDVTFTKVKYADTAWVPMGYELQYPYRYYEVLSIDGILMDGRNILKYVKVEDGPYNTYYDFVEGVSRLPYIVRYTGGLANPNVEWKKAFPEQAYPHRIVEQKFVDGKATDVYRTTEEHAGRLPMIQITDMGRELKINLLSESLAPVNLVGNLDVPYVWYTVDNTTPLGKDNNEIWVDKVSAGFGPSADWWLNPAMDSTDYDYSDIIDDILDAARKNVTNHN